MDVNERNDSQMAEAPAQVVVAERPSAALAGIEVEDRGGFLWGIIGFLSPIIGLILHLIMRKSLPKNAKALKVGIIVAFILIVLGIIAYMLLIGVLVAAGVSDPLSGIY